MDNLIEISDRLLKRVDFSFTRGLLTEVEWSNRLIEIRGARGTGKTTLMLQRAKQLRKEKSVLYTSLDLPYFYTHSLFDLADTFYKSGGEVLFLDEIHKYPRVKDGQDWSNEVKAIYDSFPELMLVYSGSSLLHLYTGNGDLSRRKASYELQGLSYREFLKFHHAIDIAAIPLDDILNHHVDIASEINATVRPLAHFKDYLHFGYYPFFKESIPAYTSRLQHVINLIIESDIPATVSIPSENTEKLKKLLGAISTTVPYTPNLKELSANLSISDTRTTLKYLTMLENAGLIKQLSTESTGNKILQKPDKIYVQNTNLLCALSYKDADIGTVRETFFYSQLAKEHRVTYPKIGDFMVDDHRLFEVGGKAKTQKQLRAYDGEKYTISDGIEIGFAHKIPLWLFGFLY